jgi:hypothetical protein
MSSQEFVIALIHNNEKDRLSKIIPRIEEVELAGYKKFVKEYSRQKEVKYNFIQVMKFTLLFATTTIKWSNYLNKKKSFYNVYEMLVIFLPFSTYSRYKKYRQKVAINHEATLKHVNALKDFTSSKTNYALILESDAEIFNIKKLEDSLQDAIKQFKVHEYCYAIIGDGLNYNKLGIDSISKSSNASLSIYDMPFSNTTVAYFMDIKTAKVILQKILKYPSSVPYPGADWLFNYAFIELRAIQKQIKCITFHDQIIGHGSISGSSQSWQSKFN